MNVKITSILVKKSCYHKIDEFNFERKIIFCFFVTETGHKIITFNSLFQVSIDFTDPSIYFRKLEQLCKMQFSSAGNFNLV